MLSGVLATCSSNSSTTVLSLGYSVSVALKSLRMSERSSSVVISISLSFWPAFPDAFFTISMKCSSSLFAVSSLKRSVQYSRTMTYFPLISAILNVKSNFAIVLDIPVLSASLPLSLKSSDSLFCITSITSNSGFLDISRWTSTASTSSSNGYSWFSYALRHVSLTSLRNSLNVLFFSGLPLIARVLTNIPSIFSVSLWVLPLIGEPITMSSWRLYLLSVTIAAARNTM